jgi:hypothetical protein
MAYVPDRNVVISQGNEYSIYDLVGIIGEQNAEIKRLQVLLGVKDQQIAQVETALAVARSHMDPYETACEISRIAAPTNEDMRRLRAAEVAIPYCGRPKVAETRSVSLVAYDSKDGLAARLERARERMRVIECNPEAGINPLNRGPAA